MAQSPDDELATFLAALPVYMQKVLWHDPHMSQLEVLDWMHSVRPFSEELVEEMHRRVHWKPSSESFNEGELRTRFEHLLQQCDSVRWEQYRKNVETARTRDADLFAPMPRRKRGRKENIKLAERIVALDRAGISNRQIQSILEADNVNISLPAVE